VTPPIRPSPPSLFARSRWSSVARLAFALFTAAAGVVIIVVVVGGGALVAVPLIADATACWGGKGVAPLRSRLLSSAATFLLRGSPCNLVDDDDDGDDNTVVVFGVESVDSKCASLLLAGSDRRRFKIGVVLLLPADR